MTRPQQKMLEYGKTSIDYHLTYADRETLAIHVHPDLHVTVEAPLDSDFSEIEKRLRKRASWILRQQQNFRRYSFDIPPRQYVSGETHRYLGKQYQLKVLQAENKKEYIKMDREHILVGVRDKSDHEQVKKRLTNWYRQRAYEIFCERVEVWIPRFERYGIKRPEVAVRQMHSQWGSCSVKGSMNLNLKLVMVPRQFIDYVIVHELCHLVEHNHSPSFYALMSKVMPDWEEKRESLNKFEFQQSSVSNLIASCAGGKRIQSVGLKSYIYIEHPDGRKWAHKMIQGNKGAELVDQSILARAFRGELVNS